MTPAIQTTAKVMKYELSDVVRSRWLVGYTLFFLAITDALLRFGGGSGQALLSLMNVVLLIIPLVCLVFGTMYVYNAREFTELLLAQPVGRRQLYSGLYLGLTMPLSAALVAGMGVPFVIHGMEDTTHRGTLFAMLAVGVALTFVFTALAFVVAFRFEEKVKGLGVSIALWLGLAILYDGAILILATMFADYPLERPLLGLMLANPVDLARVTLLLQFDIAALMGYTGAVFKSFFGSAGGRALAATALLLWVAIPVLYGSRVFRRKDF